METYLDHPFLGGLIGDRETAQILSAEREIKALLMLEGLLARLEGEWGVIPKEAACKIASLCISFSPDPDKLRKDTQKDGVVMPGLVRQLKGVLGPDTAPFVHFGATSQDMVDTCFVLRAVNILNLFDERLKAIEFTLKQMTSRWGSAYLTGKTRMQTALPMTVFDRIRNWFEPLDGIFDDLTYVKKDMAKISFAGAVGNLDKFKKNIGSQIRTAMAMELNLSDPGGPWHVQRLSLGRLGALLSHITAHLGKIGADVGLMVLNEVGTLQLSQGGMSSAMPHKNNPVDAEVLKSLAAYNGALLSSLNASLIHEQERSGAMWTLEWLTLPQMFVTAGSALNRAIHLLERIEELGD